jgi:hypothetical protein
LKKWGAPSFGTVGGGDGGGGPVVLLPGLGEVLGPALRKRLRVGHRSCTPRVAPASTPSAVRQGLLTFECSFSRRRSDGEAGAVRPAQPPARGGTHRRSVRSRSSCAGGGRAPIGDVPRSDVRFRKRRALNDFFHSGFSRGPPGIRRDRQLQTPPGDMFATPYTSIRALAAALLVAGSAEAFTASPLALSTLPRQASVSRGLAAPRLAALGAAARRGGLLLARATADDDEPAIRIGHGWDIHRMTTPELAGQVPFLLAGGGDVEWVACLRNPRCRHGENR